MQNRFLSNLVVLTVFITGFFAISFSINTFSYKDEFVEQEYSFERRTADKLAQDQNWQAAARYYQRIIQEDPDNGGATINYADCIAQRRIPHLRTIYNQRRSGSPDQKIIDDALAQANQLAEEIIPAYEAALRFPRHRNDARFSLAMLHSMRGEKRLAVDYLLAALNGGFRPRRSIGHYLQFQPILNEPEIQALR